MYIHISILVCVILYATRYETVVLSSSPACAPYSFRISDVLVSTTLMTVLGQAMMEIVIQRGPRVCLSIAG
jgi:hypothetical protein